MTVKLSSIQINFYSIWTMDMHATILGVDHTYIIDHYNPSVRIINLVSHTTYVVCVIFFT